MSSQDLLHQALGIWEWEPSILIGLAIWQAGYLWLMRTQRSHHPWKPVSIVRKVLFSLGTLVAFLALVSPLDYIADHYLFSAHMLQHLLLIMVAPPLWLLGLPEDFLDGLGLPQKVQAVIHRITQPVVAFLLFNAVLLIWHFPTFYEATLENNTLHIGEHLLFIGSALIGWWPVLGRSERIAPPLARPLQVLYMFLMMFPMTLVGVLITFAREPLIPFYVRAPRLWELAANPGQSITTFGSVTGGWGLSVMDDQATAGLLMWVPGNMIYMFALFGALYAWFQQMDSADRKHVD